MDNGLREALDEIPDDLARFALVAENENDGSRPLNEHGGIAVSAPEGLIQKIHSQIEGALIKHVGDHEDPDTAHYTLTSAVLTDAYEEEIRISTCAGGLLGTFDMAVGAFLAAGDSPEYETILSRESENPRAEIVVALGEWLEEVPDEDLDDLRDGSALGGPDGTNIDIE